MLSSRFADFAYAAIDFAMPIIIIRRHIYFAPLRHAILRRLFSLLIRHAAMLMPITPLIICRLRFRHYSLLPLLLLIFAIFDDCRHVYFVFDAADYYAAATPIIAMPFRA